MELLDVSAPLPTVVARLGEYRPELVFNTAEGQLGRARAAQLPAILEMMAIPYVGFGLGLILAFLAGFLEFSAQAGHVSVLVMVAVVYGLGQLLESFVLTPRLVGERIGLHPLAVIFALMAFGHLLGFVGVLIALPLSAVLLVAIRRLRTAYISSPLYQE